jgi:hypothetical protein
MREKRNRSKKSIIAPSGHIKPQKKRPKRTVAIVKIRVNITRGIIIDLDASIVIKPVNGLKRRKNSLSKEYACGFVFKKKNVPTKSVTKNICRIILNVLNLNPRTNC